jgi:hypothetical protein
MPSHFLSIEKLEESRSLGSEYRRIRQGFGYNNWDRHCNRRPKKLRQTSHNLWERLSDSPDDLFLDEQT